MRLADTAILCQNDMLYALQTDLHPTKVLTYWPPPMSRQEYYLFVLYRSEMSEVR